MSARERSWLGGDVTQRKRDRDRGISFLALGPHVGFAPSLECFGGRRRSFARRVQRLLLQFLRGLQILRPSRVGRQSPALFPNQFLEFLDSQIVNQKFDASPIAILLFSQSRENPGDRLRDGQQFFRRQEGVEQFRLVRNGAQPSAHVHGKPAHFLSVFGARDPDQAQVVHVRESAGMLRAAAERGFEFPAEALAVRVAEQESRKRPGVRGDIENLILANAGEGAGGNVSDRVPAGFARGDSCGGQAAHDRGRIVNVHVMKLNVLTSGDVSDSVGVLFRKFRQGFKLRGVQAAGGYLDALHSRSIPEGIRPLGQTPGGVGELLHPLAIVPLAIVVTLAVHAPAQPRFRDQALVELPLFLQAQIRFDKCQFRGPGLPAILPERFSFQSEFEAFILSALQKQKTHCRICLRRWVEIRSL